MFQYIQQFQGYIWPGVVAAFLGSLSVARAPAPAGVLALVLGPVAYGVLQFTAKSESRPWGHELHFLIQVLAAFLFVAGVMTAVTVIKPLAAVKVLPVREEISLRTEPVVFIAGVCVILGVLAFFILFW